MSRPRLCRACHAQATYVEETDKPAIHIDRYGKVTRFTLTERVYYCDRHTGQPPRTPEASSL